MKLHRLAIALTVACLACLALQGATAAQTVVPPPVGYVQAGRYHHNKTGIEFVLPLGWTVRYAGPSSDGGEGVEVGDELLGLALSVWMIPTGDTAESRAAESIDDVFRYTVGMKIRMRFDQGLRDYWVRPANIQERIIGGRKALIALGEWTQDGRRMAECLTWIYSEKTRSFFYARTTADNLPLLQDRFEQIVATAVVP